MDPSGGNPSRMVAPQDKPELTISQLVERSFQTAKDHGWHEGRPDDGSTLGEEIVLMHSELSEAVEDWRLGHLLLGEGGIHVHAGSQTKPEGVVVEFADTIIRIADTCGRLGLDLEGALLAKMDFNDGRPYRHGGKLA